MCTWPVSIYFWNMLLWSLLNPWTSVSSTLNRVAFCTNSHYYQIHSVCISCWSKMHAFNFLFDNVYFLLDPESSFLIDFIIKTTQPVSQSVSQSLSQSVSQSAGGLVSQSVSQPVSQWFSESVSQWVSESVSQCVGESVSQWVSESVSQWVSESVSQWVSESVSESVSQWVCQWVSQSVSHLVSHSLVGKSVLPLQLNKEDTKQ